ncbi:variable surface protein Vir11, putative [Plasmodium vivax]|uniref:Variable surface protein Vir11, putative n=1 Tax=Plasmodium vivax (strain Salvador I) TaxID=126793 RepID=A5KDI6_PLAVS|nr:variable surface protein Vir11, putative [Plasmodium vivax]EDL42583.1 variable surface protein Vir11, putative [Plasmodium vivax]|eukprot:XP_001612376.1 variable surface protein Vir11 [Plasmodium vivax Sal-1]
MLRNYGLGKNVNFTFSWKMFTLVFLVLSYLTYNDVSQYCKSLEYMYKQDREWNTKFKRLLARHEQIRELESLRLRDKLQNRRPYTEKRNVYDNLSAYSHLKSNESDYIDIYMKNYKKRYMRKKGLSNLNCYCENKVFSKFNNICDIGKKMKYDEKRSKKFFLKKYGIGLFIFALIPALGFIFRILFGINRDMPGVLGICPEAHYNSVKNFEYANMIFSIIMVSIVILFFIYILIKVIKYEKIKAGKGKMNRRENIDFCKKVFKNEKY